MSDKPTCLPDLSESLIPDLAEAVHSYHAFRGTAPPDDAKEFTAYHNACKAALMHIALLCKLIQTTSSNTTIATDTTNATHWLTAARQALRNETEGENTDDLLFD